MTNSFYLHKHVPTFSFTHINMNLRGKSQFLEIDHLRPVIELKIGSTQRPKFLKLAINIFNFFLLLYINSQLSFLMKFYLSFKKNNSTNLLTVSQYMISLTKLLHICSPDLIKYQAQSGVKSYSSIYWGALVCIFILLFS